MAAQPFWQPLLLPRLPSQVLLLLLPLHPLKNTAAPLENYCRCAAHE